MSKTLASDSVGLISPQIIQFKQPLELACGQVLPEHELVVETYGELNSQKSNAILICHALSGHHHAAGFHSEDDKRPGWWDFYIGPGKPIDTDHFFVISLNNIGGCHGSTGPQSINPETGQQYGADFPPLRARDWVNSQLMLMQHYGISQWAAIIGGSLGGMQAMRWSLEHPEKLRHCIVIASAMKLTAQNIAFNEIARQAIQTDPDFFEGNYQDQDTIPKNGLALARMIGHLTYLSDDAMDAKFGRELRAGSLSFGDERQMEFQVESYLKYQGDAFAKGFDANTYILMTKALDYFDLARDYNNDAAKAFSHSQCQYFVISFSSDWRFSIQRSREIVAALLAAQKPVSYTEIESDAGHDAFLLPNERYQAAFHAYMQRVKKECN